ncbi:DNA polymerase III subunit gamma/tau [Zongyangia hominis]|uniref:DNA-directed DNA polymerase n=1 Tax=Zongyangia hominis TaxID=2763677 RepID=A0A926IBC5_9FIRM|nr:DNA polymerase III subunit gamma/tau [Zongyangia hominis]MBC8571096.1 DNA polymerase III subunit gamma/tau [Zongyangia hominis]
MYQALYRKYRPRVFEDVVGQEHITTTLRNQVEEGKCAHAYLFTGSRGTGKTTCSKILAKAVNCLSPRDGDPCGECELCVGIDEGSVLDVVEIDAASNNGVDNIRELREEANFTPVKAGYRVYIIDEAHMLSVGAFNALLKIMEEPPSHVLFILATTEVHKVPATIVSRCQRFDFRRIPSELIAGRLQYVAGQEGISLDEEAALFIARLADGGMRDALSILDLCSSYSTQVDTQVVVAASGLAGSEQIENLVQALARKDSAAAFSLIDELHQGSSDFERVCDQLIGTLRNCMMIKAVPKAQELVVTTGEHYERLALLAKELSMEDLLSTMEILQETLGRLSRASSKRTEFEMAVVKITLTRPPQAPAAGAAVPAGALEELQNRLERLETMVASGVPTAGVTSLPPRAVKKPASEASDIVPEHMEQMQQLDCWDQVMERLQGANPALHGALKDSKAYVKGDIVLIDAPDELFVKLIRQSEYTKESLRDALKAQTGKKYRLGPYKKTVREEREEDPLKQLETMAQQAGIDVSVTGQ